MIEAKKVLSREKLAWSKNVWIGRLSRTGVRSFNQCRPLLRGPSRGGRWWLGGGWQPLCDLCGAALLLVAAGWAAAGLVLRGPLPGLGLAFGLRFSPSPKHTQQPRALLANPRAGSTLHSQISTLQFEVPPSRSSRFTSTSKFINKRLFSQSTTPSTTRCSRTVAIRIKSIAKSPHCGYPCIDNEGAARHGPGQLSRLEVSYFPPSCPPRRSAPFPQEVRYLRSLTLTISPPNVDIFLNQVGRFELVCFGRRSDVPLALCCVPCETDRGRSAFLNFRLSRHCRQTSKRMENYSAPDAFRLRASCSHICPREPPPEGPQL